MPEGGEQTVNVEEQAKSIPYTLQYVLITDGPNRDILSFLNLKDLIILASTSHDINQLFKQYSYLFTLDIDHLIISLVKIPNKNQVKAMLRAIFQHQNKFQNVLQNKFQFLFQLFTYRFQKIQINEFRAIYDVSLLQMVLEEEDQEMGKVIIQFFYQLYTRGDEVDEVTATHEIKKQIKEKFDLDTNNITHYLYRQIIMADNLLNKVITQEIFNTLENTKYSLSVMTVNAINTFNQKFRDALLGYMQLGKLGKSISLKWAGILLYLLENIYSKQLDLNLRSCQLIGKADYIPLSKERADLMSHLYYEVLFSQFEQYVPVNIAQKICHGFMYVKLQNEDIQLNQYKPTLNTKTGENYYSVLKTPSNTFSNLDATSIDVYTGDLKALHISTYQLLAIRKPYLNSTKTFYSNQKNTFVKMYENPAAFYKRPVVKEKKTPAAINKKRQTEMMDDNDQNTTNQLKRVCK